MLNERLRQREKQQERDKVIEKSSMTDFPKPTPMFWCIMNICCCFILLHFLNNNGLMSDIERFAHFFLCNFLLIANPIRAMSPIDSIYLHSNTDYTIRIAPWNNHQIRSIWSAIISKFFSYLNRLQSKWFVQQEKNTKKIIKCS